MNTQGWVLTEDQRRVLRAQKCADLTDAQFEYFVTVCERTQLDPFTSQIYAVSRFSRGAKTMTIQTGIDGFRLIAQRSGGYEGQDGPHWCGADGVWRDVWISDAPPAAARVGVWRSGFREPIRAVALWEEYKQTTKEGLSAMWKQFGVLMIGKVAEALALRRAFPAELSGLYVSEEMAQSEKEPEAPKGARGSSTRSGGNAPAAESQPSGASAATTPTTATPSAGEGTSKLTPPPAKATPAQVKGLSEVLREKLRIVEPDARLTWASDRVGRRIEAPKDLTSDEVDRLTTWALVEALFPRALGIEEMTKQVSLYCGAWGVRMPDRPADLSAEESATVRAKAAAGEFPSGDAKGAA